jgi:hypothetical protein
MELSVVWLFNDVESIAEIKKAQNERIMLGYQS